MVQCFAISEAKAESVDEEEIGSHTNRRTPDEQHKVQAAPGVLMDHEGHGLEYMVPCPRVRSLMHNPT
jgi:hypothetical protein